jgi:hypothetical protein
MSHMLFTSDHRRELEESGFTRVPGVIPRALLARLLDALPSISPVDYHDRSTWYRLPRERPWIIPSHHHQAQWDIRQHPRLHQAFSELWQSEKLWVTMDRIGFVAPLRPGDKPARLHWDRDPRDKVRNYQAIVYVTDAPSEAAPFSAVPRVFQDLEGWLCQQPLDSTFRAADFSMEDVVTVPGKAGDLVIWDARLPHGPGPNTAARPRVMQAVSMFPAPRRGGGWPGERDWSREEQISWWESKRAPPWWRDVPGQRDPEPDDPAELTPLGRRLVGIEDWPDMQR